MSEIATENTLEIKQDQTHHQKNTDGHLGKICNTCGGFGFTLTFGGVSNSAGCKDCGQTGVATMSTRELQDEVVGLKQTLDELKNIIIKNMKQNV